MTLNDTANEALPTGNAYGRILREKGTTRIVVGAILLYVIWYIYATIHVGLMQKVQWSALTASPKGLAVLGLQDKDRPGKPRKYVAIEANHAWQIRRPDEEEGSSEPEAPDNSAPEAQDRGNNPGARRGVAHGEVVPVEEIMKTCPVVMIGSHFTSARVEKRSDPFFGREYWVVHVGLSDEGRSRYWQFSREHDGERLAFVLNGEIMTCPKMTHMDVSTFTIEQFWIEADANKLANYLNGPK